ncbi:MAG: vanadium-dependent haloperoxidase [Parafilimonas sp.]|nr:vanadium-dependent haloperoxidase [Parafilimonas sp.]
MKTTLTRLRIKYFAHYKKSAVKICMLSSLLFSMMLLFNSCQKNINDVPVNTSTSSQSDLQLQKYDASVATDWYRLQLRFLLHKNSTLAFGGYFGYIGIGLYESVKNMDPNAISLSEKLYQMPQMPAKENGKSYNWQLSANAAMASLVRHFYVGLSATDSASIDSMENAYNQKARYTGTDEFTRSQAFGRSIADAIYNWYLTDDINLSNVGYVPPVFPGAWVPTPPGFVNPPVLPYIGSARTYLADDLSGVAPAFPVAYSEDPNSSYYKMVKELYDVSKTLTDEQKTIANYWVDQGDGVGYTPAGHDMYLATEAIEQNGAHLLKAAEAYAKAGIAERDGAIVCFRSKYTYTLIRPVSYIQKLIDPTWLPFITTPPHPEYPAAHAAVTGSVMQALQVVFGNASVTDHAYDFRGWVPRTYSPIFDAAKEAGISRYYGGIHFRISIETGWGLAKTVGTRVGTIQLHNNNDY